MSEVAPKPRKLPNGEASMKRVVVPVFESTRSTSYWLEKEKEAWGLFEDIDIRSFCLHKFTICNGFKGNPLSKILFQHCFNQFCCFL